MSNLHQHNIVESVCHKDRATTIVQVADLDCDGEDNDLPLIEVISKLQAALEVIPQEFRNTAVLNIKGYGDYASVSSSIYFQRPETDAEFADRKRWLDSLKHDDEARDRREFERLKGKFG